MHRVRLLALAAGLVALAGGLSATKGQPPAGGFVTIKGQVKLSAPPAAKKVDVNTDKEHCLSKGPQFFEDLIVGKAGGVKNVIVYLRADSTNLKAPFPADRVNPKHKDAKPVTHTIDQPCCQFVPRIVAARAGDRLVVKNSAPVNHNTNMTADSDANPKFIFNKNLPPGGTEAPDAPLAAQGSPIPFKCDIHPWMQGRLRVFDHPYFAVTDEDGRFEIKDAPAAGVRIVYWHENGFHKGRDGRAGFPLDGHSTGDTMELKPVDLELPK